MKKLADIKKQKRLDNPDQYNTKTYKIKITNSKMDGYMYKIKINKQIID